MLQPILGGKHYIMRYEFQHRGTIHCHMVMSIENGPTLKEMDLAREDIFECPTYPNLTEFAKDIYDTEEKIQTEKARRLADYERMLIRFNEIKAAKEKMIEFNSLILGIYAVHPELDFENWPAPRGKIPDKPKSNVLRDDLLKYIGDPEGLLDFWRRLVNRVQLHKCKKGSCLTETFKTVKKDDGTKENKDIVDFTFPLN